MLQREVFRPKNVTLANESFIVSEQMPMGDVVHMNDIQPRIDERGHAPGRGLNDGAAGGRRLNVPRADRRGGVHNDDGKAGGGESAHAPLAIEL